jgi:hypothetical protein
MKLILEFTEFNAMRLGNDSVPQSTHVDNPSLSLGSYNRFQANVANSVNRLSDIFKKISLTTTGFSMKNGDTIEIKDIKNLKVLRIFPKNDIKYNIYISFELNKKEYFGIIKDIFNNPQFSCELFTDREYMLSRELIIRIKGNIIKAIKKWLDIKQGKYILLKELNVKDKYKGYIILIKPNEIVNVVNTNSDNLIIEYDNNHYIIDGKNFLYFNYYFKPIKEKE